MNAFFLMNAAAFMCCSQGVEDSSMPQTDDSQEVLYIHDTKISSGFLGNGIQFNLYEHCYNATSNWGQDFGMYMDESMWQKTFNRLSYMKLGLARTMISSKNFSFRGRDESGNPIIDSHHHIELVDRWLNYCDTNHISVLWGEWGTGTIASVTNPLWANTVVNYADYLLTNRKHRSLKYFVGINEPDGNWSDATEGDFNTWKHATENVYAALQRKGLLNQLAIAGPDACPGITGTSFITNTAAQVAGKIGLWNIHIYPYPTDIRDGSYEHKMKHWHQILGKDKKMVLGEVGMKFQKGTPAHAENIARAKADSMQKSDTTGAANMFVYDYFYAIDIADIYIQAMRAGISGACAWIACDAMNTAPGQRMKRWGLWNIFGAKMGNPADEDVRPWFYTLSLLSRYIPKGSDILQVDSSSYDGIRAVAAVVDGELTLAIVNNSQMARTVSLKKNGEPVRTMKKFICNETDRPMDVNQFPVPKETKSVDLEEGEVIELPPLGFALLTSLDY